MKILLSSNKKIIKDYIGENAKIGFIPTASEPDTDRWYMEKDRKELEDMKFQIFEIDITNETSDIIREKFKKMDAVFVAGGNCFYLLQQLKQKDVLEDLIQFSNNKIYIGSSAGSCIACPSIAYIEKLDDKMQAPLLKDYSAMNLINGYILPHYDSDIEYTKTINEIINEFPNLEFIKLRNDQAIIVNNVRDYQIKYTD